MNEFTVVLFVVFLADKALGATSGQMATYLAELIRDSAEKVDYLELKIIRIHSNLRNDMDLIVNNLQNSMLDGMYIYNEFVSDRRASVSVDSSSCVEKTQNDLMALGIELANESTVCARTAFENAATNRVEFYTIYQKFKMLEQQMINALKLCNGRINDRDACFEKILPYAYAKINGKLEELETAVSNHAKYSAKVGAVIENCGFDDAEVAFRASINADTKSFKSCIATLSS